MCSNLHRDPQCFLILNAKNIPCAAGALKSTQVVLSVVPVSVTFQSQQHDCILWIRYMIIQSPTHLFCFKCSPWKYCSVPMLCLKGLIIVNKGTKVPVKNIYTVCRYSNKDTASLGVQMHLLMNTTQNRQSIQRNCIFCVSWYHRKGTSSWI